MYSIVLFQISFMYDNNKIMDISFKLRPSLRKRYDEDESSIGRRRESNSKALDL